MGKSVLLIASTLKILLFIITMMFSSQLMRLRKSAPRSTSRMKCFAIFSSARMSVKPKLKLTLLKKAKVKKLL